MATSKPRVSTPQQSTAQWRSPKQTSVGTDFVLAKIGEVIVAGTKPTEQAAMLVAKVGRAMRSPGIPRGSVFRGAQPQKVFAFSAVPGDTRMLVREAEDGAKVLGKIGADGRFRVMRKTA